MILLQSTSISIQALSSCQKNKWKWRENWILISRIFGQEFPTLLIVISIVFSNLDLVVFFSIFKSNGSSSSKWLVSDNFFAICSAPDWSGFSFRRLRRSRITEISFLFFQSLQPRRSSAKIIPAENISELESLFMGFYGLCEISSRHFPISHSRVRRAVIIARFQPVSWLMSIERFDMFYDLFRCTIFKIFLKESHLTMTSQTKTEPVLNNNLFGLLII